MPEEIFIISLAAIVFGTTFLGFVFWNVFSLIRAKINQGSNSSGDINPQFFKALGDFKKSTERRLNNLEAIVSEIEEEKILIQEKDNSPEITIEDGEIRGEKSGKDDSNLRNMLNE